MTIGFPIRNLFHNEVDVRYMRHWNYIRNSAWGPWVIHSTQHIISGISNENGSILTQPLTYFPLNSLYTICVNGGSANAPESAGGIYTVHRVKFANFSYSEIPKIFNSEKRYERRWNTGTSTWNAWVLVQQAIV